MLKIYLEIIFIILITKISIDDIKRLSIAEKDCNMGIFIGFLFLYSNINEYNWSSFSSEIINHLIYSISIILLMISIKEISKFFTNKECLGIGDAKLASMCSIWLGLQAVSLVLILSFISAGLFSFIRMSFFKTKPFSAIPFTPFISFFSFLMLLLGENWWIRSWEALWGL